VQASPDGSRVEGKLGAAASLAGTQPHPQTPPNEKPEDLSRAAQVPVQAAPLSQVAHTGAVAQQRCGDSQIG